MTWTEAWDLASELLRDPDSHLSASLAGWVFVPGPVYRAAVDHFEWWANARRGRNTTRFQMKRPWVRAGGPLRAPTAVSEEDRVQRAKLDALLFGGTESTPPEAVGSLHQAFGGL